MCAAPAAPTFLISNQLFQHPVFVPQGSRLVYPSQNISSFAALRASFLAHGDSRQMCVPSKTLPSSSYAPPHEYQTCTDFLSQSLPSATKGRRTPQHTIAYRFFVYLVESRKHFDGDVLLLSQGTKDRGGGHIAVYLDPSNVVRVAVNSNVLSSEICVSFSQWYDIFIMVNVTAGCVYLDVATIPIGLVASKGRYSITQMMLPPDVFSSSSLAFLTDCPVVLGTNQRAIWKERTDAHSHDAFFAYGTILFSPFADDVTRFRLTSSLGCLPSSGYTGLGHYPPELYPPNVCKSYTIGTYARPLSSLRQLDAWFHSGTVNGSCSDSEFASVAVGSTVSSHPYIASLSALFRPARQDPLFRSSVPISLNGKVFSAANRPLLLVCHDMRGGYVQDKHANNYAKSFHASYNFSQWQYVDIFVYFSHHRVTIPPVMWTNAAHRNGTLVLGTFITEWEAGAHDNAELLDGCATASRGDNVSFSTRYADQLVYLCLYYGFDGWLINIESPMPGNAKAPENEMSNHSDNIYCVRLANWLSYLTHALHSAIPHGKVLWYDSLNFKTGQIDWQSELNDKNISFYSSCDGIFTDYHWKEQQPKRSACAAMKASGRSDAFNVFTGVDVYGRGTLGGGGLNTAEALRTIAAAGTSVALFATAWTYDEFAGLADLVENARAKEEDDGDEEKEGEGHVEEKEVANRGPSRATFDRIERKFWGGLPSAVDTALTSALSQGGWELEQGGDGWKVEGNVSSVTGGGVSALATYTASHGWCRRRKLVDLLRLGDEALTEEDLRRGVVVFVQEGYVGTGPNPRDLFYLNVDLLDDDKQVVDAFRSGILTATEQERFVQHTFAPNSPEAPPEDSCGRTGLHPGRRYVRYVAWEDGAKDAEGWAGHFGTKLSRPSLVITKRKLWKDDTESTAVSAYFKHRTVPFRSTIPFSHSFSTGVGRCFFGRGSKVSTDEWFSLSLQCPRLYLSLLAESGGIVEALNGVIAVDEDYDVAFDKGNSLRITYTPTGAPPPSAVPSLSKTPPYPLSLASLALPSSLPPLRSRTTPMFIDLLQFQEDDQVRWNEGVYVSYAVFTKDVYDSSPATCQRPSGLEEMSAPLLHLGLTIDLDNGEKVLLVPEQEGQLDRKRHLMSSLMSFPSLYAYVAETVHEEAETRGMYPILTKNPSELSKALFSSALLSQTALRSSFERHSSNCFPAPLTASTHTSAAAAAPGTDAHSWKRYWYFVPPYLLDGRYVRGIQVCAVWQSEISTDAVIHRNADRDRAGSRSFSANIGQVQVFPGRAYPKYDSVPLLFSTTYINRYQPLPAPSPSLLVCRARATPRWEMDSLVKGIEFVSVLLTWHSHLDESCLKNTVDADERQVDFNSSLYSCAHCKVARDICKNGYFFDIYEVQHDDDTVAGVEKWVGRSESNIFLVKARKRTKAPLLYSIRFTSVPFVPRRIAPKGRTENMGMEKENSFNSSASTTTTMARCPGDGATCTVLMRWDEQ